MKRVQLIKKITALGCQLVRHGGKHDWYRNPATGVCQPVPRHREIGEGLARHIIKLLSSPAITKKKSKDEKTAGKDDAKEFPVSEIDQGRSRKESDPSTCFEARPREAPPAEPMK